MSVIIVHCDLCQGQDFQPLYPSTIRDYDLCPEQYYSSSREKAGHLPIVRCRECGLVMTNPRDDPQTLASIYSHLQDPVYDHEGKNRERTAFQRVRMIKKFVSSPAPRLLDIGSATGIFVGAAYSVGWHALGLEPSNWSIHQARKRYPYVEFHNGRVEDRTFEAGCFDVITLWDVLEHVSSPTKTIQHISPWLALEGLLLLNVPNIDSLTAQLMGKRWVLLLREHLWYFSPATIRRLLTENGYQIIEIQHNVVTFSIENLIWRVMQYLPSFANPPPCDGFLTKFLQKASVSFPMGEMLVIARKSDTTC